MHRVIVIEYMTLDGVTEDPASWAFRYAPGAIKTDTDNFRLGDVWDRAALLFGRRTWQQLSRIWPSRTNAFATKLNRMPKLVASNSLTQVSEWNNSILIDGDLVDEVRLRKTEQDLIVIGSGSVVRTLMQHDLVDEYRVMIVPVALQLDNVQQVGEAALVTCRRANV